MCLERVFSAQEITAPQARDTEMKTVRRRTLPRHFTPPPTDRSIDRPIVQVRNREPTRRLPGLRQAVSQTSLALVVWHSRGPIINIRIPIGRVFVFRILIQTPFLLLAAVGCWRNLRSARGEIANNGGAGLRYDGGLDGIEPALEGT